MSNRAIVLSFVLSAVAAAPAAARAQAASEAPSSAIDLFHAGQEHFEHGRFVEALVQFRASLAIIDSPNTLLYIARCERELGHLARAYRQFDEAAHDADRRRSLEPRYDETLRDASAERDALTVRIAFIVLRPASLGVLTPPTLTANGESIESTTWGAPIPFDPGRLDLSLVAEGHTAHRTFDAPAGSTQTWAVELGAPSSLGSQGPWTPFRIAALAAGGVGVLAASAGIVTGILAQTRYDQLVRECNGICPPERSGEIAEGFALVTATNLLLGVGITLALGGGLGMLIAPGGSPHPTPTRVGLAPTPAGWMMSLTHSF